MNDRIIDERWGDILLSGSSPGKGWTSSKRLRVLREGCLLLTKVVTLETIEKLRHNYEKKNFLLPQRPRQAQQWGYRYGQQTCLRGKFKLSIVLKYFHFSHLEWYFWGTGERSQCTLCSRGTPVSPSLPGYSPTELGWRYLSGPKSPSHRELFSRWGLSPAPVSSAPYLQTDSSQYKSLIFRW